MKSLDIDLSKYDSEFFEVAMNRVEAAACVIRDDAKRILRGKLTGMTTIHRKTSLGFTLDIQIPWKEHGPYKGGAIWTERTKGAMVDTIRVTRSKNKKVKNVLVIAGNFKTWWAMQLEYGRGAWRGGAKSFMRPAMKGAESKIIGILEGGVAGSEEVRG